MIKWIKKIISAALAIAVVLLVIDAGLIFVFAHYQPEVAESDAIIVLGAAINSDAARNRALEGLRLFEAGKAPVIVATGGKIADPDISEAQYIQKVINKNAHDKPVVILEDQSGNTYENIKNAREKLGDADSVIVVSDSFHLARGVLLAKKFGFEDVSWSSPNEDYYRDKELHFYYFREFMAMLGYIPRFLE